LSTRIVEVRAKVMKQNDLLARTLRERFQRDATCVVGLVSSPGSGKTAFLEKLLAGLSRNYRVAALVGDLATENDAARLQRATPNPSSYDLGEELRFVLLSATEGEDKPLKYPTIFNSSDVAIITKMDLADAAEFDVAMARHNIESVRPGMRIFEVSSKTSLGMEAIFQFLQTQRTRTQEAPLEAAL